MHNHTRRTFLSFVALTTVTALTTPAFAMNTRVSTGSKGLAIRGYDTRAYWAHDEPRVGADSFVVEWQGVPWRFANQEQADLFAADPASFAPQFGGFCTRAMSFKKVVNGDPEVWRIFEGKLYLFAQPVGRKFFDKGETAMIAKAQSHWDTLG